MTTYQQQSIQKQTHFGMGNINLTLELQTNKETQITASLIKHQLQDRRCHLEFMELHSETNDTPYIPIHKLHTLGPISLYDANVGNV